jgi:plasmid stability protein
MANITVRNIPDSVFEKLKLLSEMNRRSLNNELLIALENGVKESQRRLESNPGLRVSRETQRAILDEVAGKWKDERSTAEIVKDIYDSRTLGRDFSL